MQVDKNIDMPLDKNIGVQPLKDLPNFDMSVGKNIEAQNLKKLSPVHKPTGKDVEAPILKDIPVIDKITNTATCIIENAISNNTFIKGITGSAYQPNAFLINIEITVPDTTLPNNLKHKEIGNEISLIMFIGSITGFGSI